VIAVLAGGVGAARFLQGLVRVVPPRDVTVIANTGDDLELYGLHISPDIDTVLYHLAGLADEARGWGVRDDTFHALDALARFGYPTWFRLGDRDLATCLHRTRLLRGGASLSQATAEIARALGVEAIVLPMSDDPVSTVVETEAGPLDFQRYLVERGAADAVHAVRFDGVEAARPASGALEAIETADAVIVAPSNPLVSIEPILAVPGVRQALVQTKASVIAVSPIVGGTAIKGPAARMLRDLGHDVSAAQIGRLYADFLNALVIDNADADLAEEIRALGLDVTVTDTIMVSVEAKVALARAVLLAADSQGTDA
jgi:LPPG:FO 2-phospho-L-lactate transferase